MKKQTKLPISDLTIWLDKILKENQYSKWNIEYVCGFTECLRLVKNYLKQK